MNKCNKLYFLSDVVVIPYGEIAVFEKSSFLHKEFVGESSAGPAPHDRLGHPHHLQRLARPPKTFSGPSTKGINRLFFPDFPDFSDFLGRLQPSTTTIQKTPNALGVEESSSPRRVLHF